MVLKNICQITYHMVVGSSLPPIRFRNHFAQWSSHHGSKGKESHEGDEEAEEALCVRGTLMI